MLLHDRKQLDISQKASFYLPELRGTNKQNIVIQDLLWHQSGMVSYYPTTWDRTRLPGGGLKPTLYSAIADSAFTLQVAPNLWARTALKDSVWKWVVQSPMSKKVDDGKPAYVYSDLNFLTLQKIVERITKRQPGLPGIREQDVEEALKTADRMIYGDTYTDLSNESMRLLRTVAIQAYGQRRAILMQSAVMQSTTTPISESS